MENPSHSFTKKPYNGNGFGAKTVYDDVFGGPPKFGVPTLSPRLEDYTEIFGTFHASRASSIPVLDLPPADDDADDFDLRSSHFDYSEVFGGFNGLDFAFSYEELFNQSKTMNESSDEAWTPAQSEFLSDESDPSASSERNQSSSNGESYESYGCTKQFNVSYNRVSQGRIENMSNGRAHVTQVHAVPGFTCVVNGITLSQKVEDRNTSSQVTDDLNPNVDFSGGLKEGKLFRKAMSHLSNSSFDIQKLGADLKPVGHRKTASHMNEGFLSVSDISLRTQPSHLPPPSRPPPDLVVKGGDPASQKSKFKTSKSFAFGDMAGDRSPRFFDVEVDASSAAAVSAAAMKDAMDKAQAKIRSAKELKERKKEGLQSGTKLGLKNDTKEEGKAGKTNDGSNCSKDEGVHGTCQRDCSGMKTFAGEEEQTLMKSKEVVSASIEGEKHINVAKISAEKKHGKDYKSQEYYKTEAIVEWREVPQFYEVVETDKSRKILEQPKNENILVQNTMFHECVQEKQATTACQQQEEYNKKIIAQRESREWDGNKVKLKETKETSRQEEHEKKVKVNQEVCEQEENGKKLWMAQKYGDNEKILTGSAKSEECENLGEVQLKDNDVEVKKKLKEPAMEENEQRQKEILERERYEKRLKEAIEQADNEKRLKLALDQEEKEKQQREACEREEKEKRQKEAREKENNKILKEAREREENEKRLKEACEREENEKRLKEACEREENEKRLKEACEREENEKRLREALEQEETERRLRMALEREENERQKLAHERDESEKRFIENLRQEENEMKVRGTLQEEKSGKKGKEAHAREEYEEMPNEACESEENEKRLKEAWEQEENEKRLQEVYEREESEKSSKEAFKQKEIGKKSEEANECEENQKRIEDVGYWEELKGHNKDNELNEMDEIERKLKSDQGTCVQTKGENFMASDGVCNLHDHEILQTGQAPSKEYDDILKVKETKGTISDEEDKTMRAEPVNGEGQVEEVEWVDMLFEEQLNLSGMAQGDTQHERNQIRMQDARESLHLHDSMPKVVEAGTGNEQSQVDGNMKASEIASNPGKPNVLTHELDKGPNTKDVQATYDKEESKDQFMSSHVVKELIENGRKIVADQPTVLEGRRNAQSTAQKVSTSQNTHTKEIHDILTPKEREKQERIKRERELEKERLRKIEEEREREKDRMAVDRATLEARERAFFETRERAQRTAVERATAEVRQRAMAEARERLEKASAEARERSLADKAPIEARLRAERAAVERATAEARERAFQKAMAEKATFGSRERVERSVADKSSVSYKNGGVRESSSYFDLQDVQCEDVRSSCGSIYSCSSGHGGVEGESAQRCKARLERHQRTAERAAKALAEKNMRDFLAQREQAERNRLAEALDAEVKRWSSGKEGNLRALLSTLQYILGPDSGWHAIPLTEVITSAAVKKAYRKATLCVHPDKLQQRGASIQQKYICEKVFDLLKEAWNKFNSEER